MKIKKKALAIFTLLILALMVTEKSVGDLTRFSSPVITTSLPIMTVGEADNLTSEELRALFNK